MHNYTKWASWGLCINRQPTYLNPTKYFQPMSSDYTRPWKLWLGSWSSIGGGGGGLKCTKIVRRCTKSVRNKHTISHWWHATVIWYGQNPKLFVIRLCIPNFWMLNLHQNIISQANKNSLLYAMPSIFVRKLWVGRIPNISVARRPVYAHRHRL